MPRAATAVKVNKKKTQSPAEIGEWLTDKEHQGVQFFVGKVKELLGEKLLELRLFGSKVRGDFDEESDIDILVVIDSNDWKLKDKVCDIAADADVEYGCNISPVIYTREEHERNKYFRTLFIQEVERDGILIR